MSDMTWPIEIILKTPITVKQNGADVTVTTIRLTEPKAKHLRYIPAEPMDAYFLVPFVASLAGITKDEAGELSLSDMITISNSLDPFLQGLPATGKI